jgi:hypothetical protein
LITKQTIMGSNGEGVPGAAPIVGSECPVPPIVIMGSLWPERQ